MAELLYVHPSGHLNDLVVPAGAVSCLNAARGGRLGRYAFEVTPKEIRDAKVLAVDLHWALGLSGFGKLIDYLRAHNPGAPLIVGGITSGHYPLELLRRYPIDFVLRGDSEPVFASLVDSLISGGGEVDHPNLIARGVNKRGTPLRMTEAELDATDCLGLDWFPTYARAAQWDSAAFGQYLTIPAARACTMRCSTCYGSYAETFGGGYLARSPEGLASAVTQAREMGVRNPRLFLGKPVPSRLTAWFRSLAEAGPFHFGGTVGLFLCLAPSDEDLDLLERAFSSQVALSFIPPQEHEPRLPPAALSTEMEGWRHVASRAAASRRLFLDAWITKQENESFLKRKLQAKSSKRVQVSLGAVWNVIRPVDGKSVDFDRLDDAMKEVWTYYAARLLSPSLAKMLVPFGFLDEIDGDPTSLGYSEDWLEPFWSLILQQWRENSLPLMPGLGFLAVPLILQGAKEPRRRGHGTRHQGAMRLVGSDNYSVAGLGGVKLRFGSDHRAVFLGGEIHAGERFDAIGLIPVLPGESIESAVRRRPEEGLAVVRMPRSSIGGSIQIHIAVCVQAADVMVRGRDDGVLAEGRADLRYFRRASPQVSVSSP